MKGFDIMIILAYVGFYGENPTEDQDNDLRYQTEIEIDDSIFGENVAAADTIDFFDKTALKLLNFDCANKITGCDIDTVWFSCWTQNKEYAQCVYVSWNPIKQEYEFVTG